MYYLCNMIKVTRKILLFAALLLSSTCCIYAQTYKVNVSVGAMDSINIVEKLYPIHNPLVVIDGLLIEDKPAITFDRDSINTFVTKICPIIQENDIDYISYLDNPSITNITICNNNGAILVRTKPESGIDTILLNGHVSKRKNKVELFHFVSSKPPKFSLLEKKWNLNRITSLKIHANGKEVIDDNNNKHIIFVEVETK